jgi:O-antigen ligase
MDMTGKNKPFLFWYIWDIAIVVLLVADSLEPSNLVSLAIVAMSIISIMNKSSIGCLYFMLMIFPYELIINYNGASLLFIINAVMCVRFYLVSTSKKISLPLLLSFLYLAAFEFANSYSRGTGLGDLVHWISILCVFVFACNFLRYKDFDIRKASYYLACGYIGVITAVMIATGGSITAFIGNASDIMSSNRFGNAISFLGGSMGIPIYGLLLISVMLINYFRVSQLVWRLFSIVMMFIAVVFGVLSASRIFIYGMVPIISLFVLYVGTRSKRKIGKTIVLIVIMVVVYLSFGENLQWIGSGMATRIEHSATEDVRMLIHKETISFLFEHPFILMFGLGANQYYSYGAKYGYLFSAHTHNLYLDVLISWGIVGAVFYATIISSLVKRARRRYAASFLSLIPLLVVLTWFMTAGASESYKVWVFILFGITCLYYGDEKQAKEAKGKNDEKERCSLQ